MVGNGSEADYSKQGQTCDERHSIPAQPPLYIDNIDQ